MKVLVVSHPAVLPANQPVYVELRHYGWDVWLVTPDRWRHEYAPDAFPAAYLYELSGQAIPLSTAGIGFPQRHVHLARPSRLLRRLRPDVVFLEQEPTSLVTGQWLPSLIRARVPFGLQQDENLERPLPAIARAIRAASLPRAAFVAARSPRAAELLAGRVSAPVIPHTVLTWTDLERRPTTTPTVGFAGRLLPEKGVHDLLAATENPPFPLRLLVVGDGPLRQDVETAGGFNRTIEIRRGVKHEAMGAAFSEMDVLVLPSRTTPTWSEQFGRVLVEAMSVETPVIGSDSGEIPWVVASGGGGRTFPERNVKALREEILTLLTNDAHRHELGKRGAEGVRESFSNTAAARKLNAALREAVG